MPRARGAAPVLAALVLATGAPRAGSAQAVTALPGLPVSPRFAGLADAGVAMIGYAGSVFVNPAGIAPVRVMSLEGAYARVSDSATSFMGAAGVRLGPVNLGGGLRYLRYDADAAVHDNLESVVALVGRFKGLALGVAGDYFAVEARDGSTTRTLTADAALTVAFFDIAALALAVQNIGRSGLGTDILQLPSTVHLGLSLNLIDTYSNGRLLATLEHVWERGANRLVFGVEAGAVFYGVGLVGRLGTGGRAPASPFTNPGWGGSVVVGRAAFDYAYLDRFAEGPVHMVGLRLTL